MQINNVLDIFVKKNWNLEVYLKTRLTSPKKMFTVHFNYPSPLIVYISQGVSRRFDIIMIAISTKIVKSP